MKYSQTITWTAFALIIVLFTIISFGEQAKALESADVLRTTFQPVHTTISCPMNLPEGEVDGETVICGQVNVPENWDAPGERELNITYAILKAKSGAPFEEPILYLEGGPGGSALEDIEKLSGYFSKLRETRDFIYYDQRGTAYSSNLECPSAIQGKPIADALEEADEAEAGDGEDVDGEGDVDDVSEQDTETEFEPISILVPILERDPQEVLDQVRSMGSPAETGCYEYFQEEGLDLTQYTTANSIRDLTALMQALAYDVYNVYGISYGSRLGLELLRTYAEAGDSAELPEIRSVVIDGIDPPHIDIITQSPFARMDITLRMLSDCEAEEACGAAYPDIRRRAVELLAQAEVSPLEITSSEGMTETVTVAGLSALLTGSTVADGEELNLIGYPEVIPYLPALVDELSNGVGNTFMGLKQGLLPPEAAAEVQNGVTLFDPLALRTQQLSQEAETLSQELARLSAQAQRSSDALGGEERLPDFFARELVQLAGEQASFESMGAFGKPFFQAFATQEPNLENLAAMIDFLELDNIGQATLNGIINLMDDDEIAETVELVLSDRVLEQLADAIQSQMNTAVLCNDMYAQFDVESAFEAYRNAEAPQLLSDTGFLVTYIARCERYNLTAGAGESAEPVVSEIPILIANGSIDFTTPVEWGEAAAEHLPNAQLVTIPMLDHGATAKSACGQDIVHHFFTYPDMMVDTGCTEELRPVFILPHDESVTEE
jgi:pimeloyl-ACP methyl ester carboxylesterase